MYFTSGKFKPFQRMSSNSYSVIFYRLLKESRRIDLCYLQGEKMRGRKRKTSWSIQGKHRLRFIAVLWHTKCRYSDCDYWHSRMEETEQDDDPVFHSFKVFTKIQPELGLLFTSYKAVFSVLMGNELLNGIIKTMPKYLICSSTNAEFFHPEKAVMFQQNTALLNQVWTLAVIL